MSGFVRNLGLVAAVIAVCGCAGGGPATYPVKGKVSLSGGQIEDLAGSHVEAALIDDNLVRASGEIGPDGSFNLQSSHAGSIWNGARAGHYRIRILLADDDKVRRRRAGQAVAVRYLQFATSGFSCEVPSAGDVRLAVAHR